MKSSPEAFLVALPYDAKDVIRGESCAQKLVLIGLSWVIGEGSPNRAVARRKRSRLGEGVT